ncbi:twin-arginine translocation pathway signal protein [Novosphingobium sp. 1949]|uniref:Twin-arginine translocation pathway signal protein n=1 Tax=Novosphingobium organovorum TaxID=2930092 RepID=A0ABT0BFU6_9SPHN|nr:twin-arginine translocation pathway signal protein [Novosphingobium organovorum]MCJ2183896.1 twin-arginine translocation pathway signal protein [Novosphingobium organovorum]
MAGFTKAGSGLAAMVLAVLALAGPVSGSALAQEPAHSTPARPLVPADFRVPTRVETAHFTIVPLGPKLARIDYEAYMASVEHLQKTFSRSTSWPHAGITDADTIADMTSEAERFKARTSFAYSVLTPDGKRERGCIYVQPSRVPGYDAVVRLWVTKAEYDAGFDAQLYAFVQGWIAQKWPFANVAYPGRAIDWARWDALSGKEGPEN